MAGYGANASVVVFVSDTRTDGKPANKEASWTGKIYSLNPYNIAVVFLSPPITFHTASPTNAESGLQVPANIVGVVVGVLVVILIAFVLVMICAVIYSRKKGRKRS